MGDDTTRQKMSVMASAAAWGLGQWDSMEDYVRSIPRQTMEGSFYQALLHIHQRQFDDAQKVRRCPRPTDYRDLFLSFPLPPSLPPSVSTHHVTFWMQS